jgi:glycosyltransferase involved in cell wall biosynthesis
VERLRDHIPTEDLPALIESADVGLAPYRDDLFTDGIVPTKLMEYAAMGLPCIAARTTAIAAFFGDANVEFFTPGDAADLARCIRLLHADPTRRAALAGRSSAFTDAHNWRTEGPAYVALVERLASGASG